MKPLETTSKLLERALLELNEELVEEIVSKAMERNSASKTIGSLISVTLIRIGESWERGELALSQVYMSSIICEKIIDKLLPSTSPVRKHQPKLAIGVFEDFHLMGKRIIYATLRANGIELMDLGGGLTAEKIVDIVQKENIKILLLSVLMLPSAMRMKTLIQKLEDKDVKVVVGGAPFRFDEALVEEIGAHYYGKDSAEALEIVNSLMEGEK
jgi:methanogenic corrinoid protein MtbC1